MEYLLLFFGVTSAVAAIGCLVPRAHGEADVFGSISVALVAVLSVVGCGAFAWLMLTRRIASSEVEAFFSFLLLAAFLWAASFLAPMARRNRDAFGITCAIVAALIALAAWLFVGTGVGSR